MGHNNTDKQYLQEQIRKAAGQVDDVFKQAVPTEVNRSTKLQVCDYMMEATNDKT